ncbi:hypothetical protein EJ05DRAFT_514718 [Pseudovirgaria hyperparasitica]|uniref:Uncharacterized protein n=1 Tax=Pseudovirgaria hyperparasitica TaxID=470096 RepID=A0A6A6VU91_9PEZI|nr:uncharacterized protein EJ05DRAFT_514718 [Pseudovirgaria hyperparasitica]KAF2753783.1 hypothetical protein EJ05DRAFT_514718 [Pseudovirgaria hyperparasitica]
MKATIATILATVLATAQAYDAVTVSKQTWFGYPDNCLDGYHAGCGNNQVAYSCVGRGARAGGDGSYDKPLTYATKKGGSLHKPCEITWFPYLKKYLVMADICTGCNDKQIDIWIGDGDGGQAELNCENNSPSGGGHKLIRDGSNGHSPNTNKLWSSSGGCKVSQNVYPDGN